MNDTELSQAIHTPLKTWNGTHIVNSFGVTIAQTTDAKTASAMVTLINRAAEQLKRT